MRLISSMAVLLLAASWGCGRPLASVDQAIARVSRRAPIGIYGQVYEGQLQVALRLCELHNPYTGFFYEFKDVDRQAWKALMTNEQASIYARLCAAQFLLDRDEEARAFVKQQLASDNLRHRYNAAELIRRYVGRDPSKTWGIGLMTEMLTCNLLEARKHDHSLAGDSPNRDRCDPERVLDFLEGDWSDLELNPVRDIQRDLEMIGKTVSAVPAQDKVDGSEAEKKAKDEAAHGNK